MNYSKPMIELVYQIRRFVPSELKPAIKLANPELFSELHRYYHNESSAVSKALIKELFFLAGDNWAKKLEQPESETPAQSVQVYRGQRKLEERKSPANDEPKKPAKTKMYRGQIVRA